MPLQAGEQAIVVVPRSLPSWGDPGTDLERHDIPGGTRALVEGDDDLRPGFEQRRDGTRQPGVTGGGRARVHVVAFVRRHEAERGKV